MQSSSGKKLRMVSRIPSVKMIKVIIGWEALSKGKTQGTEVAK